MAQQTSPAMDDETFFEEAAALVIVEDDVQKRFFDAFVEATNHPHDRRALEHAVAIIGDPQLRDERAAQLRVTGDAA